MMITSSRVATVRHVLVVQLNLQETKPGKSWHNWVTVGAWPVDRSGLCMLNFELTVL